MTGLTAERLRELLHYDPETGVFTRLSGQYAGKAGCVATGCIAITVDGRKYKAHRLAFLFVLGRWPTEHIDHVNGDFTDNRWANLREATPSQNMVNRSHPRPRRPDLPRGVHEERPGRFQARIYRGRRSIYLGTFDTLEAAVAAHERAALQVHGDFMPVHFREASQ